MKIFCWVLAWVAFGAGSIWVWNNVGSFGKQEYQVGSCYETVVKGQNPFEQEEQIIIRILDKKDGWVQYQYCLDFDFSYRLGEQSKYGRLYREMRDKINKLSKKDGYYQEMWGEVPCPEGCQ